MTLQNVPIAYDFHGDTPFSVPFPEIKPEDIHVYLDLDTKIGKNTCGQKCTHCWFVNYEKVYEKSFAMEEGPRIKASLEEQGYRIYPRYVDSFAYEGAFMRLYGPANNREFRQESDHRPTRTMERGDAWTSGRPLLADNYVQLLDLARESGYGTISITYHGLIREDLTVADHVGYPIKGVFSGRETEVVVRRITDYNRRRAALAASYGEEADPFRVNIGVTVGRHNNSREALTRYVHYFNRLGVETVRFNNFADHGGRHPELPLDKEEIEQVYRDLKWLHETVPMDFQLAVSEDFGTFGIKEMGFPGHVGWCRAGRQLFAVIPTEEQVTVDAEGERLERIGSIVGCVNTFEPHLGELVRRTDTEDGAVSYLLEFDHQAIADFTAKRLSGVYRNGCFARELAEEQQPELRIPARRRLALIETGS